MEAFGKDQGGVVVLGSHITFWSRGEDKEAPDFWHAIEAKQYRARPKKKQKNNLITLFCFFAFFFNKLELYLLYLFF